MNDSERNHFLKSLQKKSDTVQINEADPGFGFTPRSHDYYDEWMNFTEDPNVSEALRSSALHLLDMHAEILNGGFDQWYENGGNAHSVLDILVDIPGEATSKVAKLVRRSMSASAGLKKRDRYGEIQRDEESEDFLDSLTDHYYELTSQFEKEVVDWLRKNSNK